MASLQDVELPPADGEADDQPATKIVYANNGTAVEFARVRLPRQGGGRRRVGAAYRPGMQRCARRLGQHLGLRVSICTNEARAPSHQLARS